MRIVFVRAFLPQLDSRMNKYADLLKRKGSQVRFIGWQRDQQQAPGMPNPDIDLFHRPAKLGARWKNLFALLAWNLHVVRTLFRKRHTTDAVHAVDLDSALAAYIFCRLCKKAFVFDIYDHYADTRSITGLARSIFCGIENFLARHADLTLLADEPRYRQHGLSHQPNITVIENVPISTIEPPACPAGPSSPVRLGYLGVFEPRHRGLENLLSAFAGQPGIELHFGGYGPLNDMIRAAAEQHDNVFLHGALDYETGLHMLSGMHCVAGFYYLSVPNHRYAAPNKYYEHLLLGRPLLTTRGTPPGDRVEREQTGWALDENVQALQAWFAEISVEELERRGQRAKALWQSSYADYATGALTTRYHEALVRLVEK